MLAAPAAAQDCMALLDLSTKELLASAGAMRDRGKGRTITYSRKVFIPLVNLCRDRCGYCTFARSDDDPAAHVMTPEEVLAIARMGQRAGCKEALFSLGDQPERRFSLIARRLRELGYDSTLAYLQAMCKLVLEETGLLPHPNPGIIPPEVLDGLKPISVSGGIMLESSSRRLLRPGMAHHRCPDKVPNVRLRTIAAAGDRRMAFTTGLLIGIGETWEERLETLLAIRKVSERYGHIQEVIVQNFRSKPDILMHDWPEPSSEDMLRTIALARLVLGPQANIQAPPNLASDSYARYLQAGLNDWGGISPVTLDHINPERPWPEIAALRAATEAEGYELRERLAIYPEYIRRAGFLTPELRSRVESLVDERGLVRKELTW